MLKMWSNNNFKFTYESSQNQNVASHFSHQLLKSDLSKMNGNLLDDVNKLMKEKCVYIPNFLCKSNDKSWFDKLKQEISSQSKINWSKHQKIENPTCSETFNEIVKKMATHCNVNVIETRLNFYKDGNDWKPFHQDRHAYGNIKENYTMGLSLGSERQIDFKHIQSKNKFSFPQKNGDLFAFDKEINQLFEHGIPKDYTQKGERFSIIAWGIKL